MKIIQATNIKLQNLIAKHYKEPKHMAKIHCDIDVSLKQSLKIIAAKQGRKIREIITILVAEYVKKNKY